MTSENNVTALGVVKGLKEAVLDAGMRITEGNNSWPRNRENRNTSRNRSKATGRESACSSRARKKKSKKKPPMRCGFIAAHQERLWMSTHAISISDWRKEERQAAELHHLIMSTLQPQYKYKQELKAVMSRSCVECEHTVTMRQNKELECDGSIRPGDGLQVQQLLQHFTPEWLSKSTEIKSSVVWNVMIQNVLLGLVPKLCERSRKKVGERGRRGALKEQNWRKGKDAGCTSLSGALMSVWAPSLCQSSLLLHPARVLKDTSSQQICDLPADPPTSCTNILAGVSQPSFLRQEDWGAGRASWFGEGVGLILTPAPPSSRAPNPPGSQIKTYAGRQPAAGSATLCRPRRPGPVSLLDGLPVAVSLAFLPRLAAAAASFAAVASVPGAAGQAGLAAVLQCGAGVSPLQPVVIQQLGLEHRQVLFATADFSSQQHDVSPIPCFL